jgi:hypothetical protein
MEKPPFQFGLKTVFGVMSGVSILLAAATALPPRTFWGLIAITIIWALGLAGGIVFAFAISAAFDLGFRLLGRERKKSHPPQS